MEKAYQLLINRRFFAFQGSRSFEENLNRYRKKLFRPSRAVSRKYCPVSAFDISNVFFEGTDKHALTHTSGPAMT